MNRTTIGIICALLAAVSNATIGLFTNLTMSDNLHAEAISFYRCVVALAIISPIIIAKAFISKSPMKLFPVGWWKIALCAFFGVFILYFFETFSYAYLPVANVTFLLMGSSSILTFLLAKMLLGESATLPRIVGFVSVLAGTLLMLGEFQTESLSFLGCLFSVSAGVGYSMFLLLTKKFKLEFSLESLWLFFAAGTLYLAVPFLLMDGSFALSTSSIPTILFLGIVPTLGGYFFTIKALENIEASKTQLLELSEPVFASLLAYLFLSQSLTVQDFVGATTILLGLAISEKKFGSSAKASVTQ